MGSIYIQDVIKLAHAYKGYKEGSNNWNIFADILDKCNYFAPQKKQGIAWCAVYTDCLLTLAAIPEDRPNTEKKLDAQKAQYQPSYYNYSAGVKEDAQYFKNAGAWYKEPKLGDKIFFNVNGSLGHEGLVIELTGDKIYTSEGNANNRVEERSYTRSQIGSKIAGFGRPNYAGYSPEPQPEPPTPTDKYTVVTNSGDSLRLRAEPNTSSKQVGYIPNGSTTIALDVVEGESIGGVTSWVRTRDGNFYDGFSEGYASGKYLSPTPEIKPEPQPVKKRYKVVTSSGDSLRIRAEANTDSKQVGYIEQGTIINVLGFVEGESIGGVTSWALTEDGHFYGDYKRGYASAYYLEEV